MPPNFICSRRLVVHPSASVTRQPGAVRRYPLHKDGGWHTQTPQPLFSQKTRREDLGCESNLRFHGARPSVRLRLSALEGVGKSAGQGRGGFPGLRSADFGTSQSLRGIPIRIHTSAIATSTKAEQARLPRWAPAPAGNSRLGMRLDSTEVILGLGKDDELATQRRERDNARRMRP